MTIASVIHIGKIYKNAFNSKLSINIITCKHNKQMAFLFYLTISSAVHCLL